MRGSVKLFTWWKIPVHMHWTFLFILAFVYWEGYSNGYDWMGYLWLLGLFLLLFTCVLLHEYGHSLTARRYGVQTQDIILTPIGGIARLERMPEKPLQEFLVAVAGPLVNVAIAAVLFIAARFFFGEEQWLAFRDMIVSDAEQQEPSLWLYIPVLFISNIALVIFNMIPAFPMDGGRILRSLLAMRIGRVRATRIAALVGQVFAAIFIVYGLYSNAFTLALIGFFVFTTARSESSMVQLDDLLGRFRASDVVRPQFTRVLTTDWMQTPVTLLQQGLERHFLVFDLADQLTGILEEEQIVAALKKRDLSADVQAYMETPPTTVHPAESLRYVYYLLRQKGHAILAVADEDGLKGVIDDAGLSNFLRLQTQK